MKLDQFIPKSLLSRILFKHAPSYLIKTSSKEELWHTVEDKFESLLVLDFHFPRSISIVIKNKIVILLKDYNASNNIVPFTKRGLRWTILQRKLFCYDQIDFLSHATIDNVMYRLSYLFLSFLYPHFAF